jgi:hypothetical protein
MVEQVECRAWEPLPNRGLAASALKVALDVAYRLRDPAQVEAAALEAKLQSNLPKGPHWTPFAFAQGYTGLALLWGQLDRCFPGEGWDAVAHEHIEIAAHSAASQMYLGPGAFGGLGGLAFTAFFLSRKGTRYQKLITTLEQGLIRKLKPLVAEMVSRSDSVPVHAFDVISGLSGVALYLLRRRDSAELDDALGEVLRCLVHLSHEDNGLPRWHSSAQQLHGDEIMERMYPNGNLNCGLAHGIPGPLGALSLAYRSGVVCDGIEDAIDRLAKWLLAHRADDQWGINWPTAVGLLPPGHPEGPVAPASASPSGPGNASWCYGSPGIARALFFAGLALGSAGYREAAISAIEDVLRRPVRARRLESPTFCHGVAGLLAIVQRFASEVDSPTLQAGAASLTEQLLSLYEPESLLGFRSVELEGRRVDQPGLLDGAPGVALALLSASTGVEPAWDHLFLLS